jgi:hypothetical protein
MAAKEVKFSVEARDKMLRCDMPPNFQHDHLPTYCGTDGFTVVSKICGPTKCKGWSQTAAGLASPRQDGSNASLTAKGDRASGAAATIRPAGRRGG